MVSFSPLQLFLEALLPRKATQPPTYACLESFCIPLPLRKKALPEGFMCCNFCGVDGGHCLAFVCLPQWSGFSHQPNCSLLCLHSNDMNSWKLENITPQWLRINWLMFASSLFPSHPLSSLSQSPTSSSHFLPSPSQPPPKEHRRAVENLIDERRAQFLRQKEQELEERQAEEKAEAERRAIIEQERRRLLREHASKLLGYLPKVLYMHL